eukprot:g20882.t1
MIGDVKEAFLRGKRMVDLYETPEDADVFCQIPLAIQNLVVPGLPGEAVVQKYFLDKLAELARVGKEDLPGKVKVLELEAEKETPCLRQWSQNNSLVNPHSIRFVDQLLPHSQREAAPDGGFGVHVDDLIFGGGLFFHLRMCVLFTLFDLGSFSILEEGFRDVYIGRELAVVPFLYDQHTAAAHLSENKSLFDQSKTELPEHALVPAGEAELRLIEERVGFGPSRAPIAYEETKKIPYCPLLAAEKHRMLQPVVYHVGQEVYAEKIKPLEEAEVTQYFEAREKAAGDRWKLRNVKSPLKG